MLRIREILKLKGITAKELAARLEISEGALSATLNGNPTLERLNAIASALGVEVSELFAPSESNTVVCPKCGAVLELKEKA